MDGPLHDGRLVDLARQRRSRSEGIISCPIHLDATRAPSSAGVLLVPHHDDDGTLVRERELDFSDLNLILCGECTG